MPALGSALGGGSGGGLGIGSIFSANSWVTAGKNLWSGFSTFFGGSGVDGVGGNFMGNFVTDNGATSWTPSGLGSAIGIAGGLYAGYNRY